MRENFNGQMLGCYHDYHSKKQSNMYLESLSGCGSDLDATVEMREHLPIIFNKFNIKSVVDAPCGDWNWMRFVDLTNISYMGYDILEDILEENIKKYSSDNVKFEFKDIVNEDIIKSDLIICRDFMFHISNEKGISLLDNFKKSGAKYVLLTNFKKTEFNQNLGFDEWGWREVNMKIEPFNLSEPIYEFTENHPNCAGRSLGLWQIN